METVPDPLDGVLGPKMTRHRVSVCQFHHRSYLAAGHYEQKLLLPPPLGGTIEQAIPDDEVRDGMRCWLEILSFRNPHLRPAVLQAIILVLLLRESPTSCHLLKHIKI